LLRGDFQSHPAIGVATVAVPGEGHCPDSRPLMSAASRRRDASAVRLSG
jgi:hypothetical protein